LIFEEKWSVDTENNLSEIFAKTTLRKSREVLKLLVEPACNLTQYINKIVRKIEFFTNERLRELKLLEDIFLQNKTLQQRVGKKQFLIAFKNYSKKIKQIEEFFESLETQVFKIKSLLCSVYDFRKIEDRQRWKENVEKEKRLKEKFINKTKKAIKRIIYALQEKMLYLIETKYITTKKIIFKAHYKTNGEFWYLTKLYDKSYVEPIIVYNKALQKKLLNK